MFSSRIELVITFTPRLFCFESNGFEFINWKIWSTGWPGHHPTQPHFSFLWGLMTNQVFDISVPNVSQLNQRIMIATRTVSQQIINYVRISIENQLYSDIRELGGHVEQQ